MTDDPDGIVVGVDGSPSALEAVAWAAEEAVLRRIPLRLVFAVDPMCEAGLLAPDRPMAERALADAIEQVRSAHPSVEVVPLIVHASPVAALVRVASPAAMICLGSNGARPTHPGHRTSTATEVLLAAECPVAIVRESAPRYGWAVTLVEEEPSACDVLNLAVAEAVLRGLPLRVVTSWTLRTAPSTADGDLDRRLRRDLDRWRRRYPHLDAVVVGVPDLDDFLTRAAGRIALFVAPPQSTHGVGTVIHPCAVSALGLLDCPVIFSPDATPAVDGQESVPGATQCTRVPLSSGKPNT